MLVHHLLQAVFVQAGVTRRSNSRTASFQRHNEVVCKMSDERAIDLRALVGHALNKSGGDIVPTTEVGAAEVTKERGVLRGSSFHELLKKDVVLSR